MSDITGTLTPAPTAGSALLRALKSFGLLRESWVGMIGAGLVIFWILVAIFAPLISPFDPLELAVRMAKPGVVDPPMAQSSSRRKVAGPAAQFS